MNGPLQIKSELRSINRKVSINRLSGRLLRGLMNEPYTIGRQKL